MFRRTRTRAILKAIDAANLTQEDIAPKIGYHPVTLNNIIHHRYRAKLNPQKVPALAEILGVSYKKTARLFGLRYTPSLWAMTDSNRRPPACKAGGRFCVDDN